MQELHSFHICSSTDLIFNKHYYSGVFDQVEIISCDPFSIFWYREFLMLLYVHVSFINKHIMESDSRWYTIYIFVIRF